MTRPANISRTGIFAVVMIGAIVATLCDANHVLTGTISYGRDTVAGQPWWVVFEFAFSFLVMCTGYLVLADVLGSAVATAESRSPGSPRAFFEALLAFVLVYLTSGFGSDSPLPLSALFYSTFVLRWLLTYERTWLLVLAALMAIGGVLGEAAIATAGLAAYRHTDFLHVPAWLGGLYLHGAFALRESMRCFVYRGTAASVARAGAAS